MSSNREPYFSVVMATFGRGRHIEPSIQSVLAQTHRGFELIVVGDHSIDDTEAVVKAYAASGVRWINLDSRCGSQSAPNNAGIQAANGDLIAYIGHDDIWEQDHLSRLAEIFSRDSQIDFAVGGAIFHLPNGIPESQVTGIFEDDSAKHIHFFPPSSFAHRKSVCDKIGMWRMPFEICAPVDGDFLLRAAAADLRFASTGKISVHKFAAGHRYLSYWKHSSDEQKNMLRGMNSQDHARRTERIVEESKQSGTFMVVRHIDYEQFAPGELARKSASLKGNRQKPMPLPKQGIKMYPESGSFALDWHEEPINQIRWSLLNPIPKILLPYTHDAKVRFIFQAFHEDRAALDQIVLECKEKKMEIKGRRHQQSQDLWSAEFYATLHLHPTEMTVVDVHLFDKQIPLRTRRGLGIGAMRILPLTIRSWLRPETLSRKLHGAFP